MSTTRCQHCLEVIEEGAEIGTIAEPDKPWAGRFGEVSVMHMDCAISYEAHTTVVYSSL